MDAHPSLVDCLERYAGADDRRKAVATTVAAIADTAIAVAETLALGGLAVIEREARGQNVHGEVQTDMDVWTHRSFRAALRDCPVAAFLSEEADELEIWDEARPLRVALDPFDGSGNVDINMVGGTIFSIVPNAPGEESVWPTGAQQLAAGFVLYGPQTSLVLTLDDGVDVFTFDRRNRTFILAHAGVRAGVPSRDEYAINASNWRHWEAPVKAYVEECLAGLEGSQGRNFNMRWCGAMVADAYRILLRGGIYLYPADTREGYEQGRLRLAYEANPVALLIERAGGVATNGRGRILEIVPRSLHQCVPFVFGSPRHVERFKELYNQPGLWLQTASPLLGTRRLFTV